MSSQAATRVSWKPLRDEELNWFAAPEMLALNRRPLEFTLEVDAFCFGLTRALESLEFPLTEIRPRQVEGRLYLAVAPSVQAEKDLSRRLRNVQDLTIRYTKDIKGFWQAQVKPKIEDYNRWLGQFVKASGSSAELAEGVRQLRRVRGNQWFNVCRPALAPAAILRRRYEEALHESSHDNEAVGVLRRGAEDGAAVAREAVSLVNRGRTILIASLREVGARLSDVSSIGEPEDVFWLTWMEVRGALERGEDCRHTVQERKAEAAGRAPSNPPRTLGPELPPDAPRMYLIPEILNLLG